MPLEETNQGRSPEAPLPLRVRVAACVHGAWRPAGTVIAVCLALLVTWHVVYGKDGLAAWQKKRTEERILDQQIRDLRQENAALQQENQQLQSDPDAIEREAREKLRYAKPGEVIYVLPGAPQAQPSGK